MKKTFTFMVASLLTVCTAASANELPSDKALPVNGEFTLIVDQSVPSKSTRPARDFSFNKEGKTPTPKIEKNQYTEQIATRLMGMRKVRNAAVNASSIEGDWIFSLGNYYMTEYVPVLEYESQYTATLYDNNIVVFECNEPTYYERPIVGILDPANGNLTFDNRIIGSMQTMPPFPWLWYLFQEPFYCADNGSPVYRDIVAVYDEVAETITFEPDNGIEWTWYGDEDQQEFIVTDFICDFILGVKGNLVDQDDINWKDAGTVEFIDGWILPALGIDQFENKYVVNLQQHIIDENMYRLVDPYHVGPAAPFNTCKQKGYIVLNLSDPNHVIVNPGMVRNGFGNLDLGSPYFYSYNELQYLVNITQMDPSRIIQAMGNEIPYTKFENNIVKLERFTVPTGENAGQTFYDANFGFVDDRAGGYNWPTPQGYDYIPDMTTYIFFPGYDISGVNDIDIDSNESAKAEYFDMNGIRVDNPTKGIYIVKKGSKVSKEIIK